MNFKKKYQMLRRKFSPVDLIRFHNFAKQSDLQPIQMVKAYCEMYPEKSAKEQLINIAIASGSEIMYQALTGEQPCTCEPDETTGNTEFEVGILSCNICGGFVKLKGCDNAELQKET